MGAAQLTAAPDASGQLQMTHCNMEAAGDKIPMRHSIVAAALRQVHQLMKYTEGQNDMRRTKKSLRLSLIAWHPHLLSVTMRGIDACLEVLRERPMCCPVLWNEVGVYSFECIYFCYVKACLARSSLRVGKMLLKPS